MPLRKYVEQYVAESESPKRYHQWCFVSSVATMLGRNYYLPFGFSDVYANTFCMLIGEPGARKSTAIKAVTKLVKEAGYERIAANKTTKEKFLLDLYGHKDDTGVGHTVEAITNKTFQNLFESDAIDSDCEIMIAADEFTNFTGAGNYEFISLLGELWDCPDNYINRVKNSKSFTIKEPCVNILSGNTQAGFAAAFPPEVLGQGFISRLILVFGERTAVRNTIPRMPDAAIRAELVEQLANIRLNQRGAAEISKEAFDAIDWLYKNWVDLDDMRFKNYSSRRLTHLLKLCLVFSALHQRMTIELEDVITANTMLSVTEEDMPKALGEFGKGKYSDVANKIVDFVSRSDDPVDANAIWKHVSTDLEKMPQLTDILIGLVKADKIQTTRAGFLPIKKIKREDGKFFDLDLIGGR